jgi:SPP1 gp7 family putative phage head morphogenesis protein
MERLDVEMLRAFGIPEKTVVEGMGVGTYGAVAQQMMILFAMIEGVLSQFVESFQRYVIDKALAANGLAEGSVTITFVPLTNRPDAFVYEVIKLLMANPEFVQGILGGGIDLRQLLEQAGLPVTEHLEATLQAVAQRVQVAVAPQAGEFGALGRRQWQNNRKAVNDVLDDVKTGKVSDLMATELLASLGVPAERAAAFIQDVKDGTIDDPELQEPVALVDGWLVSKKKLNLASQKPAALAQVVIPRQGFKVPQASQVVNAGLREFDRLYAELVDAMSKGATQATLSGIIQRIDDTEVAMRIAGRVLGMLSPWQPRVNTYADGAAKEETEGIKALADSPYRFPWIESAVEFLQDQGVISAGDFAKMAQADRRAVDAESAMDSPKRLRRLSKQLADSIERGDDLRTFSAAIKDETALSRSQTETLYRTMTKRGYTAGFDVSMKSPVVAAEFPAVLFTATPDARVRDDHWDLDGVVVMRSDARAYRALRKAADDYNCRCSLIPLSAAEAAQRGVKAYGDLPGDVRAKYA